MKPTPNQLSIFRIVLTPFFVWTFLLNDSIWKIVALAIFTVASITDWYDGRLARKFGLVSVWGRFLDPLADKILVLTVFMVFAIVKEVLLWMVLVIVIRDVIVTGLRIYAMYKKHPISTSYLAKAKTTSQLIVIFILLIYSVLKIYASQGILWAADVVRFFAAYEIINILMWIVVLLTVFTGIQYLVENKVHVKSLFWDIFHVFYTSDV
ncbi:CDP-diacylglycerol--glycerol-3-phosphate 3-phosphatidyltransferase [bacterium BMS3Abin05]|nr:CDP-diacylglycerol--glycerol-3-phosphate 3-phosphatidyltransferase [bacterium BMS3Abin05]GBE28524.1 CDP-diacylglycerol--glycerol-3-phosphate 3-phosphatidyltransferase [bacterium BMS3Bbin03]HDL78169.1 CDP-diacylglycerol--glycerol-3-phosphate 3-phosphatidyltransferase [Bacteroidota bacterium]HDZ10965.1 CDP-diacylglycerol--glycerol-3-phosphate 3-phosphatidyltransferase [Bacteroidota bacterium]